MVLASIFIGLLTMWATEVIFESDIISNTINAFRKIFEETEEEVT